MDLNPNGINTKNEKKKKGKVKRQEKGEIKTAMTLIHKIQRTINFRELQSHVTLDSPHDE